VVPPTVYRLEAGRWIKAGSGVIDAQYGPGGWRATLAGKVISGPLGLSGYADSTLIMSHGSSRTSIRDVTAFAWAPSASTAARRSIPPPATAPTISPTTGTTPSAGAGLVVLAPGIVHDSLTSRVVAFVNKYFTAINEHSFRKYDALLDPTMQQNETAQSFHAGFRTTTDSVAMITAISTVSPGVVGATMTFVSHQSPADSATGTACTDWNITLYLQDYTGQYRLRSAPPGYHSAFKAC
jgi:hypothetical protein